jgi:hypothetical protein
MSSEDVEEARQQLLQFKDGRKPPLDILRQFLRAVRGGATAAVGLGWWVAAADRRNTFAAESGSQDKEPRGCSQLRIAGAAALQEPASRRRA